MKSPILPAAAIIALSSIAALTSSDAAALPAEAAVNRGVVQLETGGSVGISVRIAEDLAKVLNDGTTRRILPVVGTGSLQNLTDLKLLHGIDLTILQTDVLDYAKQQNLFPGIESSITYIAKLYNEEFHLLARPEIKSVADLANQKVSVDLSGAATAITAGRLFDLLKIAVTTTNDDPETGLEKLRRGEIAAVALVTGKPAPLFCELIGESGLHFLAIPIDPAVTAAYIPARFTAEDYPGLVPYNQPVDTVAVSTVLAVANLQVGSERYRNVANFVEVFFTQFPRLLEAPHHPKWNEVNLAAELPHWRRFPAAENWIKRNGGTPVALNEDQMRDIFAKFLDERSRASGATALSGEQKTQLFDQFRRWQGEHLR